MAAWITTHLPVRSSSLLWYRGPQVRPGLMESLVERDSPEPLEGRDRLALLDVQDPLAQPDPLAGQVPLK